MEGGHIFYTSFIRFTREGGIDPSEANTSTKSGWTEAHV